MSDELRIVLVGAAKAALDRALADLQRDERISVNSSKLANSIVLDYCERYLRARKRYLVEAHLNERKCFEIAMRIEDPEARRRALREAAMAISSASKPKTMPKKMRGTEPEETE